jgi:hypothetical protein
MEIGFEDEIALFLCERDVYAFQAVNLLVEVKRI